MEYTKRTRQQTPNKEPTLTDNNKTQLNSMGFRKKINKKRRTHRHAVEYSELKVRQGPGLTGKMASAPAAPPTASRIQRGNDGGGEGGGESKMGATTTEAHFLICEDECYIWFGLLIRLGRVVH